MNKYSGKEFCDPVIRCDNCSKITHRKFLSTFGGCYHCGNKRFSAIRAMSEEEYNGLKDETLEIGIKKPYKIDPEFFEIFEPAKEVESD